VLNELLGSDVEGEDDSSADDALLAICLAAQQDRDFGPVAVQQVLASLGLGHYWVEAQQYGVEVAEEDAADET